MSEADSAEIERAFRRDGYIRIPVFNAAEVREIRQDIYDLFRRRHGEIGKSDARDLTSRDLLSPGKVLAAVVHPRITALLKTLLGPDCMYVPDFEVHINQYGIGKGAWHIDCGSEVPQPYLLEPDYRFVKCGIYLQENSPDLAGGIDVLPGLHRCFPPFGSVRNRFRVQREATRLVRGIRSRRVPTAAGDFVAFDSRLPHRGSAPGRALLAQISSKHTATNNFSGVIPPGRDKMVIYYDACRAAYAESFLDNSVERAKEEMQYPVALQYRAQYLGLQYPQDFPPEFRRALEASGIRMATYRGPDKTFWVEHWRKHQSAVSQ